MECPSDRHPFPPALVSDVQQIIDSWDTGVTGVSDAFNEVMNKLNAIIYNCTLKPEEVMVHPANRDGLGINSYDCHESGAIIVQAGFNFNEVDGKAAAFELCPFGDRKDKACAFNDNMIAGSNGMLPKRAGIERFLTVSCVHTVHFLRAVNGKCVTHVESLKSAAGLLDPDVLSQGKPTLRQALRDGFKWRVFPWTCEVAWPRLPHMAQCALNASNQVATSVHICSARYSRCRAFAACILFAHLWCSAAHIARTTHDVFLQGLGGAHIYAPCFTHGVRTSCKSAIGLFRREARAAICERGRCSKRKASCK
jgi:hypothetical protein